MDIFIHQYVRKGGGFYQSLWKASLWIPSPLAPGSRLSAGVNRLIDTMELSHGKNVAVSVRVARPACAVPSSPGMPWALLEIPVRELVCQGGGRGL